MLLKFKNDNILLKMNTEDRHCFLSIINSINQKTEELTNIILSLNNSNITYSFNFQYIFEDIGINIFSIFIYSTKIDILSSKFKQNISKIKHEDIQYLYNHFDFIKFKKDIDYFKELQLLFKQKYIIEPFHNNINKLNTFIPKKYNHEILNFQMIYNINVNRITISFDFHHLNINNMNEIKKYINTYFSEILFFFNIDTELDLDSMFEYMIEQDEHSYHKSCDANLIFEKLLLTENINYF